MSNPFAEPRRVAELLAGFDRPWFVAGGWALDLFIGRVTRAHEDVEVAVHRRDQHALREHLAGWEWKIVVPGSRGGQRPWTSAEVLMPPLHELRARRAGAALEVLLEESFAGEWRYRRDITVTRPLATLGLRSSSGIPILAPEVALLYKAKQPRERDHADLEAVLPRLGPERRNWLRAALETAHPRHVWLGRL